MITIDGTTYDFFCDIDREAEVQYSDLSGQLMDKNYFADPIATYLKYTLTVVVPLTMLAEYDEFYEILTDPVAEHTVILPYGQGTIEIHGRIETVSDRYYKGIWRGTKFTVISNEPLKVPE